MAVHDTEQNDRSKYTKECLNSFLDTVDLDKHRLFISDNGSCSETQEIYTDFLNKAKYNKNITFSFNGINLGTANAINLGIKTRQFKEHVCKADNDVFWHNSSWADQIEYVFRDYENVGVCGLKREDVWQNTEHENPLYRTFMDGRIEVCDDIIGTCTGLNYRLLDKVGYFNQPSGKYGGDDVLMSARSISSGFKNCFLPHIKITHLDDGQNPYCDWKKKEAGFYLQEIGMMVEMYKNGRLNTYYDGGFND